jgi:hypothetical protein
MAPIQKMQPHGRPQNDTYFAAVQLDPDAFQDFGCDHACRAALFQIMSCPFIFWVCSGIMGRLLGARDTVFLI